MVAAKKEIYINSMNGTTEFTISITADVKHVQERNKSVKNVKTWQE